ncbi:hypothetical protein JHK82_016323 [Glycine max]|nr:hypothetical protein JHK85_016735 [Glycine max]KAG5149442.1 hypothetical protein JHK82_016323 [Glycine max]
MGVRDDGSPCRHRVRESDNKSRLQLLRIQGVWRHRGVFIYHKAFPMPALSFKFYSSDPLSGNEEDDSAQFITSVCWRGQSSTLVAANSTGNVKILEMT